MSDSGDFVPAIDEAALHEGEMKLVKLEGIPFLFVRAGGRVFVFDNRCPHMGCAFSGGTLDGSIIICPCHDWRFSLKTGEYEAEPSYKLKFYEWKIEAGKIWVKLEE